MTAENFNSKELNAVVMDALRLSTLDRIALVEEVLATVKLELSDTQSGPRKSYKGILKGLSVSEEDITSMRHDVWSNFPREDV